MCVFFKTVEFSEKKNYQGQEEAKDILCLYVCTHRIAPYIFLRRANVSVVQHLMEH